LSEHFTIPDGIQFLEVYFEELSVFIQPYAAWAKYRKNTVMATCKKALRTAAIKDLTNYSYKM